jgi:transposase
MGDMLIMNRKDRERKVIMNSYKEGRYSLVEASERMGVSYRQGKRIWRRYQKEGDVGLLHRSRGKKSKRAINPKIKKSVLKIYQEKYDGFGPTLAAEKLEEEEGFKLSDETLRQWLKQSHLWGPHRKRKSYRRYRERKSCFGELLQIDGSDHPWFGDETRRDCLLNMVDDATGITFALLDRGETTYILLKALKHWVERYGIPDAVYVDLKNVYVSPKSLKESIDCPQERFSIFEQVCQQLNIKIIKAYSPQAKGRVERKHGVFQDRFVKELKLRKIKTIEKANEYLEKEFLDKINTKFAKAPKDPEDHHRDVKPYGDLNQIFCWNYQRSLKNDWTILYEGKYYQIEKTQPLMRPRQKINVRTYLNGHISLMHGERHLNYQVIDQRPQPQRKIESKEVGSLRSEIARKNKNKTPWSNNPDGWLKKKQNSFQDSHFRNESLVERIFNLDDGDIFNLVTEGTF